MDLSAIPTAEFNIEFSVEAGERGHLPPEPALLAIAAALGLGPQVTPRYTSVRGGAPRAAGRGERHDGFARVNGLRGVAVDGQKVARILYSYYLTRHGALMFWTADLDAAAHPALRRSNDVWFRDGDLSVLVSVELRAAVEVLAPKRRARRG